MPYVNPALRPSAIALCSLCFSTAQAKTFVGKVIGIADGDTLTVLNSEKQEIKIWLAETRSASSIRLRSKQSLSDLCFGHQAEIITQTKDRYKWTVARVKWAGVDVNTEQGIRGFASRELNSFVQLENDSNVQSLEN